MLGLAQNCAVSTGIISGHWPLGLLQGFNSQLHHFSIKIILKDVSLFLISDPFYFPLLLFLAEERASSLPPSLPLYMTSPVHS